MSSQSIALSLADDLFVQCQTLSPWTVNYVDLEESLAVGSIAQEVLAQGGVLYAFAGLSDAERDARVYQRPASEWKVSQLSFYSDRHWPDLVASAYLCAQASRCTVNSLMSTSDAAEEQLHLVHSEQVLHVSHWKMWVSLLLANAETSGEMASAIDGALVKAGDLFPDGADHDAIFDMWVADVSVDFAAWKVSSSPAVARQDRATGQDKVDKIVADLRTARSATGQSNYAIY